MATCPACGGQAPDGLSFCPACGAPLGGAPTAAVPSRPAAPGHPPQPSPTFPAPPPPAGRGKTAVVVIVGIIVALLLCCCVSAAGGALWWRSRRSAEQTPVTSTEDTAAPEPDGSEEHAADPEGTVDTFYEALADGDFDAIQAVLAEEAAPGDFEAIEPASYRIAGSQVGDGEATVDVQESSGGLFGGNTTVTFHLVDTGEGWRISGWETAADTGADPRGGLDAGTARETVSEMLLALAEDRTAQARSHATKRFLAADAGFFTPTKGTFLDFLVSETVQDGDGWLVTTEETWKSGMEVATYRVIMDGGEPRVDGVSYYGD